MTAFLPILPPSVKIVTRGDKHIFINPDLPRWIVTDEVGRLLLSLFDGRHTVDDIVALAAEALGDGVGERARRFCEGVAASGLLEQRTPTPRSHRMRLSSVHLSLSDGCNLNCAYCYARERRERGFAPLTPGERRRLVDDILGISPSTTFTLTGGEPLLNSDCLPLARYIRDKGARTLLLTNGLLVDEGNAADIASLFSLVTLSVDGPNDKVHALTRGHNFERVMAAARLLESHGADYTLSMTVTRKNIGCVEEMARLFGSRLNFAPYFPISGEPSELAVTGLEYYEALKNAAGVKPLGHCEGALDDALECRIHKCAIADGEFSVSATGDVYPCQLLHTEEFYAGNVHERGIKEIYYDGAPMRRLARLDVVTMEGCRDCPLKFVCGGGCRARAYYEGGDVAASSDFCRYEQEAFFDGIVSLYSHNALDPIDPR